MRTSQLLLAVGYFTLLLLVLAAVGGYANTLHSSSHHVLDMQQHRTRKAYSRLAPDVADADHESAVASLERVGDAEVDELHKDHSEKLARVEKQVKEAAKKDEKASREASKLQKDPAQSGAFGSKKHTKKKTHVQRYKEWQKDLYEAHKLGLREQHLRDKASEAELAPEGIRKKGEKEPYTQHLHRVQRGDKPLHKPAKVDAATTDETQSEGELRYGYKDRAAGEGLSARDAENDEPVPDAWEHTPEAGAARSSDEKKKEATSDEKKPPSSSHRAFTSQDAAGKKSKDDDDDDDDIDVEEYRKKVYQRGPAGLSREERRKLRKKAHIMSDDEFNELQNSIDDPTLRDPGKCQSVAAKFCRGLMYSFAEFTLCAIRNKHKFTGQDAHCVFDFVEMYLDCAPDMVKYCPGMDGFHTNKCLLSPKMQPLLSEACKESEFWEVLMMESARMQEIERAMIEDEEKEYAHDPEGLEQLRQARADYNRRINHPDIDPSRFVKTSHFRGDRVKTAGAHRATGDADDTVGTDGNDPVVKILHKMGVKNYQADAYRLEDEENIEQDDPVPGDDL